MMVLPAELYALLGDTDQAIGTLSQALDAGYRDRYFPRILPALHEIRDDPRFAALYAGDSGSP